MPTATQLLSREEFERIALEAIGTMPPGLSREEFEAHIQKAAEFHTAVKEQGDVIVGEHPRAPGRLARLNEALEPLARPQTAGDIGALLAPSAMGPIASGIADMARTVRLGYRQAGALRAIPRALAIQAERAGIGGGQGADVADKILATRPMAGASSVAGRDLYELYKAKPPAPALTPGQQSLVTALTKQGVPETDAINAATGKGLRISAGWRPRAPTMPTAGPETAPPPAQPPIARPEPSSSVLEASPPRSRLIIDEAMEEAIAKHRASGTAARPLKPAIAVVRRAEALAKLTLRADEFALATKWSQAGMADTTIAMNIRALRAEQALRQSPSFATTPTAEETEAVVASKNVGKGDVRRRQARQKAIVDER